jgi:hypothetical protein
MVVISAHRETAPAGKPGVVSRIGDQSSIMSDIGRRRRTSRRDMDRMTDSQLTSFGRASPSSLREGWNLRPVGGHTAHDGCGAHLRARLERQFPARPRLCHRRPRFVRVNGYVGDTDIFPTYDKAELNGRVYSDKPFGVSMLYVPVYAALQVVARVFGFEWALPIKIFVLRMTSTSVPAAASIALSWLIMVRFGTPPKRALATVVIAFFGSMWFGYSLLVMPYSPGIASCLAAIYLTFQPPHDVTRSPGRRRLASSLAGDH